FPAERIEMHGNNKSEDELRQALAAGVGRIIVDSFDELDRLERIARETNTRPAVHVRVTPGVPAHTHAHIETGAEDSKFGFNLTSGDALRAAVRAHESATLRCAGLHCHIGSQIFRMDAFERALHKMAGLIRAFEDATGATIDECNVGGGL